MYVRMQSQLRSSQAYQLLCSAAAWASWDLAEEQSPSAPGRAQPKAPVYV